MPGDFYGSEPPAVIQPNRAGHLEIWRGKAPRGKADRLIQQEAEIAALLDKLPAEERDEIKAGYAIVTRSLPAEYLR